MTEKEKMINEVLYDPSHIELVKDRMKAKKLCRKFNIEVYGEKEIRDEILAELFKTDVKPHIEPNFWCDYGYNIAFGKNFYSNHNLIILDVAPVVFGDDVMIAPNVQIYTASHPLNPNERCSGLEFGKKVVIGNKVWIGGGAIILPGVTLGDNVVVAAGAVVTKPFPDNVVIGGNPAKIIKKVRI